MGVGCAPPVLCGSEMRPYAYPVLALLRDRLHLEDAHLAILGRVRVLPAVGVELDAGAACRGRSGR